MKNEMIILIDKLVASHIPFQVTIEDWLDGEYHHVFYPADWESGTCKCSVISHPYSYGGRDGKLEIMGLLTEEESEYDDVLGYLDADDVFARIYADYMNKDEQSLFFLYKFFVRITYENQFDIFSYKCYHIIVKREDIKEKS